MDQDASCVPEGGRFSSRAHGLRGEEEHTQTLGNGEWILNDKLERAQILRPRRGGEPFARVFYNLYNIVGLFVV